jgi:carbon monoxide dehydrogenase subunit G
MLHFEGERNFPLPPDALWEKLRDAAFLVECIPDSAVKGEPTRDRAECSVQPGFSFVRGSLDVTIEIVDGQSPTSLRFKLLSKGIGSSSEVESSVQISPAEAGSKAAWTADVKNLGGLLKMVPSGLIKGAAQRVIDDVWNGIAAKLA